MTVIEKAHFYLEIGQALKDILDALDDLESVHKNWLQDAKNTLENSTNPGQFTVSLKDIQGIRDNFLEGDFCAAYFGVKQLSLLFYRRRHFFSDTRPEEEHLELILRESAQTFNKHADSYVEDKLNAMSEQNREKFLAKLRKWSLIRGQGENATNEISTLICKEATTAPRPVLLEISLSKEIYLQAYYQRDNPQTLSEDEKKKLEDFIASFETAELQSWKI